tara:strand:+ start:49 stop:1908 length:1860 start_codon:yes stop_codon:yes gene_type:complete
MAPRSRYLGIQRQVGTSGYRGPSGIGMREAQRTSQMLTSALNDMSSYFFKKAGEQAVVEGAEYGAENPITVGQIKESALLGTDVTEKFDDDTIFGKSAKKVALESLGSDLALSAKRHMSNIITQASTRDTDLTDVSADLRAITNEYVTLAQEASPILGRKLYAELGVTSSAHYNAYSKVYAKRQIDLIQTRGALSLNLDLNNMTIELDALLNFEGNEDALTSKIYGAGLYQNGKRLNSKAVNLVELQKQPGFSITKKRDYIHKATKSKYTRTMIESSMKDWDAKWLESRTNVIVSTALETETSALIATKIQTNQKTGNVKIDSILNGMTDEERLNVAKAIRTEKTSQMNFENSLQEKNDEKSEATIASLEVSITKKLAFGDTKNVIETEIRKLEALDPDKAKEYSIKLIESGGLRTVSDPKVKKDLLELIADDSLGFGELAKHMNSLSSKDFTALSIKVEANEEDEFKGAMQIIASELEYDPEAIILGEQDENFKNKQIYIRIKGKVRDALDKAQVSKKDFDAKAVARSTLQLEGEAVQIKIYDNQLVSAKSTVNTFASIYTKKDIQKVYTRAEFTRVKTLLIAILAKKDLRAGDFRNESMIKAGIQSLNTIIANTRLP